MEKEIVVFFNKFKWKPLDLISEFISDIKILFIAWIIFVVFLISIDFKLGIYVAVELALVFIIHCIISEWLIKYQIKKVFNLERKRPYMAYPNEIRKIGNNYSDKASSFPSNHMAGITGGFVILFAAFPFILPLLIFLALLLALSRMHNGMHYPSDILAGLALGFVYGNIVLKFFPILKAIYPLSKIIGF